MKFTLAGSAVFILTACATPQQQCIRGVTGDLQVVDRLIAETEGNLARGYAYADMVVSVPEFVDCTPEPTKDDPQPRAAGCFEDVPETVTKPVAVDLHAEAGKLAGLKEKRAELAGAAAPAVADCQARFPK